MPGYQVASLRLSPKEPERPDDYDYNHVAEGIAVLAAIGASDAICYALLGERSRGQNHREALPLLGSVRYGAGDGSQRKRRSNASENHLAMALDLKDQSHYGNFPTRRTSCQESAAKCAASRRSGRRSSRVVVD